MPKRVPSYRPPLLGPPGRAAADYRRSGSRMADNQFYASTPWRTLRRAFLASVPLCHDCRQRGLMVYATEVHHIKERRDFPELAFDWDNLMALCKACHNAKRRRHAI
jgi:5-methylcytosine-specific restriction protein A